MRRTLTRIGIVPLLALLLAAPLADVVAAPAGTLDTLAADLDEKLSLALTAEPVRRCDLALSLRASDAVGARLAGAVRALVLGRLAERGLRSVSELRPEAGERARAVSAGLVRRARAGGYELLLDLELAVVEGHLHLRGVLRRTDRVLWRDLRQADRGAISHLHASARVDAEIRAYQGSGLPVGSARFSLHTFTLGQGELLALAAGDVDGDGRVELVALRPQAVEVYRRAGAGAFQPTLRFKLGSPLAALRPRRPLGALVVADLDRDGKAEILARTSELERGVELGLARDGKSLLRRKEIVSYPLAATAGSGRSVELVTALAQPGLDLFVASSLTLTPASSPDWVKGVPATFYNLRSSSISSQSGPRRFVGVVDATGGFSLIGPDAGSTIAAGPRSGVAFDLCDLDDDGSLELIASGADGPELEDGLAVFRLVVAVTGPSLKPLWRSSSLGGQVIAITHADFDGNGKLEVVAAIRQRGGVVSLVVLH